MKLRLIILPVLLYLVFTFLIPLNQWYRSGGAAWLLLIPALLGLLLFAALRLALWGGSGGLRDVIRGQSEPEPKNIQADIGLRGGGGPSYSVRASIQLGEPIAEISERYLSFAIDTAQVVGGKWWDPSAARRETGSGTISAPPFDFNRTKLDTLTAALAPAFLRIGGSEADRVYYDMRGDKSVGDISVGGSVASGNYTGGDDASGETPAGFESVLSRAQWDAANAFVDRNNLNLMFTLNAGPGTRTYAGNWHPENAKELLVYSAKKGYPIDVWEFGNELNVFFAVHGAGEQVPVDRYCQDLKRARELIMKHSHKSKLAGQGSAYWPVLGEPLSYFFGYFPEYLGGAGDLLDLVTWHYYPQQSRRGRFAVRRAYPSRLLDPVNLDEAQYWADKIAGCRDQFAGGKPIWMGETGNAQFGGEPGVSDVFIGGLWWLDQLGLMARAEQQVVVRQTLTGMDYGLIDDDTLEPRPDYWNSLLWKRLMGKMVYGVEKTGESSEKLRLYAHGSVSKDDSSVTVLAINLDHQRDAVLTLPDFFDGTCELYRITTPDIFGRTVLLNYEPLRLIDDQKLPKIFGERQENQELPTVKINPLSYAFIKFSRKRT